MKKILVLLFATVFVLGMAGVAAPTSIPVANSDFDDLPGSGITGWTPGTPASWSAIGGVGVFNPWNYESGSYAGHDGSDVALVYGDGSVLGQWLSGGSAADGRTYTLSVQAAGRNALYVDATYKLRLVAGNPSDLSQWVELAISDAFTPVVGDLQTANLIYTASSLDPTYSTLGINLLVFGAGELDQILFDNVSLDNSTASVPEPGLLLLLGPSLVGLGLVGRRKVFTE